MRTICFYAENTIRLDKILEMIDFAFDCKINREYVEMNYSEITIRATIEEIKRIQIIITPLI